MRGGMGSASKGVGERAGGSSMQRGGACTWRGRLRSGGRGPGMDTIVGCVRGWPADGTAPAGGTGTARFPLRSISLLRPGGLAGWCWSRALPAGLVGRLVWQCKGEREVRSSLACFLWLACGSLTDGHATSIDRSPSSLRASLLNL